ncbi:MAG: 2-dehydropantoate 2-reductase [Anaerolineales bacterium]
MDGTAQQPLNELLIVGTGALATLFAARLAANGVAITMLGSWQAGLDALEKNGACLTLADGSALTGRVAAVSDPASRTLAGVRLALVLVKSWQTERAAAQLRGCLSDDGLAVSLQNGLGNRETLVRFLDDSRVGLGVTTLGATLLGPGHAGFGGDGIVSLETRPRLEPLQKLLNGAGFRVDILPDARALLWGKLVVNAAINPLTALLRVPNGALLERPGARALMAGLANETAAVARALGVELPFDDPAAAVEAVARRTATNRSSMLQDAQRGPQTEIDAICGAVARAGEEVGVPTPLNRVMWQMLTP